MPVLRLAVGALEDAGLVVDPDDAPVAGDEPVVEGVRGALAVDLLVLFVHPLPVVRMQEPVPEPVVAHPLLGGVAEDRLDLRADVHGRVRLGLQVGHDVRVGDRRDLLHEHAVAPLRLVARALGELSADRGAERSGRRPERVELGGAPRPLGDAVVEAEVSPPVASDEDRHERGGEDPLRLLVAPVEALEVVELPGDDAA